MDDNLTYHPRDFNDVTEGKILFVMNGHNFTCPQITVLETKPYVNVMLYSDTKTQPLIVPVLSSSHLTKEWFS